MTGRALRAGGLVIDLTGMRGVTVDGPARTAAVLGRLLAAKRRYDPDNVFASAVPSLLG